MSSIVYSSAPRLRVNRMNPLNLTTSWQAINWDGSSIYNVNSFANISGDNPGFIYYDIDTNTIKFVPDSDQNYFATPSVSVTANTLLTTLNLASFSFANLQLQCYIPAPTPVTFPLPDQGGYVDVGPINAVPACNFQQPIPVFANQLVRDYGIKIRAKLSNAVLGTVTLNGGDLNIFKAA